MGQIRQMEKNMFTRRDFLKGSIIVGTIPTLGFVPKNVLSDDFGDTITYKNYELHWSGYQYDAGSSKLYANWTARLIEHYIFYASNVGLEGITRFYSWRFNCIG